MLSECYQDTIRMLSGCYQDAIRMLSGCYQDTIRMLSDTIRMLSGCDQNAIRYYQDAIRMLSDTIRMLSGCYQNAIRYYQDAMSAMLALSVFSSRASECFSDPSPSLTASAEPTHPRETQLHALCVRPDILCMLSAHTGTPKHEHLPIMLTPRAEHAADSKTAFKFRIIHALAREADEVPSAHG